jgi:hypothetical protein
LAVPAAIIDVEVRPKPSRHGLRVALLLLGGCGAGEQPAPDGGLPPVNPPGEVDAGLDPAGTPQVPPRARAALEEWLATGWHRQWRCETQISLPRLTGNHGRHRICSNQALLARVAGPFEVGAASVKELYVDAAGTIANGFAVGLKIAPGPGPQTWFWYERRGPTASGPVLAEGIGVPDCAVCHGAAVRDFVFFTSAD